MPDVSIIIPAFNRASVTRQCLDTLLSARGLEEHAEIIVVDDASQDLTARILASYAPRVKVVTHQSNSGFATACNDGALAASGRHLVFLNNDTMPQPGWLEHLVTYAEQHPAAAIVGSKLLYRDGTVQHAGVAIAQNGFPTHIYGGFPGDHPAVNKSRRFAAVTAASMLVRRHVFEEAHGFDAAYVNGYEDVDLCLRVGALGYEVHYCHESVAWHLEALSRKPHGDQIATSGADEQNVALFAATWARRVPSDEVRYYEADQLLAFKPYYPYPLGISVSPHLAFHEDGEYAEAVDQLIHRRAMQAHELMAENTRLRTQLDELVLAWQVAHHQGGTLPIGWPSLRANAPFFDVRTFVAGLYLHGDGIEIGALHSPIKVGPGVRVQYVDRMTVADLRRQYPELDALPLIEPDIIADGERLAPIPDASQDFVIASHFLEHCQDPIGTVEELLRVVRPGGILYLAIPDKRYTFDRHRPLTAFEHLLRDYREGPAWSKRAHFEEWASLADDENIKGRSADELIAIDYSIHFHVWTQAELLELLARLKSDLGFDFDVEIVLKNAIEVIFILRKGITAAA